MCWLPLAVWYGQGFLTPVIAVIATYVAWQQHRTNKLKVKLDIFDRRYAVYEQVSSVLWSIVRSEVTTTELFKLHQRKFEAGLLLGKPAEDFLETVYQRGVQIEQKAFGNEPPT
jgi:hypothetical protein